MKVENVKSRLDKIGHDYDWLADQVGIKTGTLKSQYMRGITPSKSVALLMINALDVDPKEIFKDEEIKKLGLSA